VYGGTDPSTGKRRSLTRTDRRIRNASQIAAAVRGHLRTKGSVVGDIDFIFVNELGRLDADLFHAPVDLPEGIVWQQS
jgi:hypothetical protein